MRKIARRICCILAGMLLLVMSVGYAENAAAITEGATMPVLVETPKGYLMGTNFKGVNIFKGIQYGTAERFMLPQAVEAWSGIHAALVYGNTSPNNSMMEGLTEYADPSGCNNIEGENCLYLNVWITSVEKGVKKPVVFWIHGGGWSSGSSNELAYYDGYNLSASQDVVFVSINHRLNVLGYTDLSAYGEEYKYSGNAGVADMVLALEWVRDNIDCFGGDPDNVTIIGQSGGGAKVTTLMGVPAAHGLFHKAIVMSGGIGGVDQATSRAAGISLVEKTKETYQVSTDEEALNILKTISYDELSTLSSGTGVGAGSVVDGDYYPVKTISDDGEVAEIAKDIPVIVTTAFSEINSSMFGYLTTGPLVNMLSVNMPVDSYLPSFAKGMMDEETRRAKLESTYGENTDAVLELFRKDFPDHDDVDLYWLDPSAVNGGLNILNALARNGNAPVYRGFWAYEFPLFGGILAPHTGGDIPFIFNNLEHVDYQVAGDEENAQKLADFASTALGNFARTGNPSQEGGEWPEYTEELGTTMVLDAHCEAREHFLQEMKDVVLQQSVMWSR